MPADASIYSMIRPAQQGPGPLDQYSAMMQLRAMGDASQLHALQRRKLETDLAEGEAWKGALGKIADFSKPLPAEVVAASPTRAMAFEKQRLEGDKTRAELLAKDRENLVALLNQSRERMKTINDPASWAAFRDERIQLAGMFSTPMIRRVAMESAMAMPAQFDPDYIRRNLLNAEKFMVPNLVERTDGQRKWMEDTNALTNPAILKGGAVQMQTTPGERLSASTTIRGQDMTDARSREVLAETVRNNRAADERARDVSLAGRLAAAQAGGRTAGEAQATAQINLPQAVSTAERASRLIDEMIGTLGRELGQGEKAVAPHKGFQTAVGATLTPGLRFVEGTDTADFMKRLDEIKGGAFLQAFESLKGGGQITEIEGRKATEAITRMDKAQSEAEFVKAAREFQSVIRSGVERAKQRAAGPSGGIRFLGYEGR